MACRLISKNETINNKGLDNFLLLRDLYGYLSILCPPLEQIEAENLATVWRDTLGSSSAPLNPVLFDSDFYNPKQIRSSPLLHYISLNGKEIPFADRGVIGADWLQGTFSETSFSEKKDTRPKRIVFYGLKGGVGRTTALCITARHLSKLGLKVLVLDMDLESPGLSSLLLPPSDLPPLGIIDWFMEDGLGQVDDSLLNEIVSTSPLAANYSGLIRVAPAFGREESGFIPKLSRVYVDLARHGDNEARSFPERFFKMLGQLEDLEAPDVVLLDSRAGMHDIAATLLVRVPDALRLLFCTNSPQTWAGYRCLFEHWQSFPKNVASFRDGLQLIDAMMPETGRMEHTREFSASAYSLFNNTLYEDVPPGEASGSNFNFQETDIDAPHSAPSILWDRKFMEFDPQTASSSFHDDRLIDLCYGQFIACIEERLQIENHQQP